ncbi:hypothetical protein [Kordiimonas sp.]|uniref:hypothetical protein n=1 Tax=Kordiimonas sp. TaxID=1970157 RepID=UPI003A933975
MLRLAGRDKAYVIGAIAAIVGSVATMFGVFGPFLEVSGLGGVSYHDVARDEANIIVMLAGMALYLSGMNGSSPRYMFPAAVAAWAVLLWPVVRLHGGLDDAPLSPLMEEATEAIIGRLFANFLNMEWGGFTLLVGMLMLLIGSGVLLASELKR